MTEAVKDIEKKEEAKVQTRAHEWASADVVVKEKTVEVYADMPGVLSNGLEVTLHRNVLEAHGSRSDYDGARKKDYKCAFTLGEEVKREGIKATVKDGVLKITIPRAKDKGLVNIPIK